MTLTGRTPTYDNEYKRYRIKTRNGGYEITDAESIDEAMEIIKLCESDDKKYGVYVEGRYEIHDRKTGEVITYHN